MTEERRIWRSERSLDSSTRRRALEHSSRSLDCKRRLENYSAHTETYDALTGTNETMMYKSRLLPLICSFGMVREIDNKLKLKKVVKRECKHLDTDLTIVFAVRRAGCASCRYNARILVDIAKEQRVSLVGVVKEVGDFAALAEFHKDYFDQFPLYKDEKWDVFSALGSRKVSTWKLLRNSPSIGRKYRDKKVRNISFGGEARILGGVMLFDRSGSLRYIHHENYGEEFPLDALHKQIIDLRKV